MSTDENDFISEETPVEKTKAEKFTDNPDAFVDVRDCLLIVSKRTTEQGDAYAVLNNCTNIKDLALTDFHSQEACQNRRDQIRMMQMERTQGGIIKPGSPQFRKPITKGAFGG
jgi:hypothetical protein